MDLGKQGGGEGRGEMGKNVVRETYGQNALYERRMNEKYNFHQIKLYFHKG